MLALLASPVAAHATLSESDPANGEQVEELPDELVLHFSGDGIEIATVEVVDADGDRIDAGEAEIDADDNRIVRVPLEDAGDGIYTVSWEVLATDGHTTGGSFFFVIGDEELDREQILALHEDSDDSEDDVIPAEAATKGVLLVSVAMLIGIPVTMLAAVYPVAHRFNVATDVGDRWVNRLLLGTSLVLLAATLLYGLIQLLTSFSALSTDTLRQFLGVDTGRAWIIQLFVAVVLVTAIALGTRDRLSPRYWLGGAIGGGLTVTALIGWTSHSASLVDRVVGTVVDASHVVGGALWVGGLLVLAIVVPRILAAEEPPGVARLVASVVRRFSIVAVAGVTLAVTGGLLLTAWHVPSLNAITGTLYGSTLGVKIALVILALGLGGFARFVLLRRLRDEPGERTTVRTLVRGVQLEVVLLVIVLLVSGLLTSTPTAAVAAGDAHDPVVVHGQADDVEIELELVPATVGPNVFDVTFTRDGNPVEPDDDVSLLMRNPRDDVTLPQRDLEPIGDGTYSTVESIPTATTWELRVTTWIDDAHVSEWVEIHVSPAGEGDQEHDDHQQEHEAHQEENTEATPAFATVLQLGALLVGVLGTVAVLYEIIVIRRTNHSG